MVTALDKNTALVLIDLQKGIVHGDKAHDTKTILSNAVLLIDAFRKANLPIVIVNVNPIGGPVSKLRVEASALPPGMTELPAGFTDIVPEIKTQPGDIFITKNTWNAFTNPSLDAELKKRGVTNIVLGSIATSIGVEGTARAASEQGYNITFAIDAMTDPSLDAHVHSMRNIFPRLGELGTSDVIVGML